MKISSELFYEEIQEEDDALFQNKKKIIKYFNQLS